MCVPVMAANSRPDIPGMVGWADSVDRLLDSSPGFVTALRAAFIRFQTPPPHAAIPTPSLLPALQFFIQRITDELDPRAGKLILRPVTREDLDALAQKDPMIDIETPVNVEKFDEIARKMLKRVAVDRGKRLGLFVLGGIVVVHIVKGVSKRIPFVGPAIGAVVNILVPTSIAGPAVGIAGALYM